MQKAPDLLCLILLSMKLTHVNYMVVIQYHCIRNWPMQNISYLGSMVILPTMALYTCRIFHIQVLWLYCSQWHCIHAEYFISRFYGYIAHNGTAYMPNISYLGSMVILLTMALHTYRTFHIQVLWLYCSQWHCIHAEYFISMFYGYIAHNGTAYMPNISYLGSMVILLTMALHTCRIFHIQVLWLYCPQWHCIHAEYFISRFYGYIAHNGTAYIPNISYLGSMVILLTMALHTCRIFHIQVLWLYCPQWHCIHAEYFISRFYGYIAHNGTAYMPNISYLGSMVILPTMALHTCRIFHIQVLWLYCPQWHCIHTEYFISRFYGYIAHNGTAYIPNISYLGSMVILHTMALHTYRIFHIYVLWLYCPQWHCIRAEYFTSTWNIIVKESW